MNKIDARVATWTQYVMKDSEAYILFGIAVSAVLYLLGRAIQFLFFKANINLRDYFVLINSSGLSGILCYYLIAPHMPLSISIIFSIFTSIISFSSGMWGRAYALKRGRSALLGAVAGILLPLVLIAVMSMKQTLATEMWWYLVLEFSVLGIYFILLVKLFM